VIIRRAKTTANFTILPNALLTDKRMSFEARGLLVYLLSKPADWTVSIGNIANQGGAWRGKKLGREKVLRILNELVQSGYAKRVQPRDDRTKQFGPVDYEVHDEPQSGFSGTG